MPEIKTPPVIEYLDGDLYYTFGPDHTYADIARWIISEGCKEEILYFLQHEDTL